MLVGRGALLNSGDISTVTYFPAESTLNHPATLQVISVLASSRNCITSSFSVERCNASLPVRFGDFSLVRLAGRSFPMERLFIGIFSSSYCGRLLSRKCIYDKDVRQQESQAYQPDK